MYCIVSFITNDNAGTIALSALLILLVSVITAINIKLDNKNQPAKEFEKFLKEFKDKSVAAKDA